MDCHQGFSIQCERGMRETTMWLWILLLLQKMWHSISHWLTSNKYINDPNRFYYDFPLSWESLNSSGISCIHFYSSYCPKNQITKKVTLPEWYFSCMNLTINIWMTCSICCSCLNNIPTYIFEIENICFRMAIEYFQRMRNRKPVGFQISY